MKVSMKEIHSKYKIDTIVSGGAFGADALAEHYAKWKRLKYKIHRPDWKKYGKLAGFIRNKLIINDCDILVAFWDGTSTTRLLLPFPPGPGAAPKHQTIPVHQCSDRGATRSLLGLAAGCVSLPPEPRQS